MESIFENELVDAPIVKLNNGTVKINKQEGKEAQTYFTTSKPLRIIL